MELFYWVFLKAIISLYSIAKNNDFWWGNCCYKKVFKLFRDFSGKRSGKCYGGKVYFPAIVLSVPDLGVGFKGYVMLSNLWASAINNDF